jgi:hypothetical protein
MLSGGRSHCSTTLPSFLRRSDPALPFSAVEASEAERTVVLHPDHSALESLPVS